MNKFWKTIKTVLTALTVATVATTANAQNKEIVTPIDAKPIAPVTAVADARKAGGYVYDRPTPENTILLLIDHQLGLMSGIRDFESLSAYKANVIALAKAAKAFDIPVLLTTSNAQWQNGDLLPELKALFPNEPIYRRTGIINAYEDPTFRKALEDLVQKTGRRHILLAGVTVGTCTLFPVLSLRQDGYSVYPVIDAAGAWNRYETETALARMVQAGAQPTTVFPLVCELQYDWKRPSANAAAGIFDHLPEYGWVFQNFWNNADSKNPAVKDPFGIKK
ncbi:MAG: hypothetical protein OHK0029_13230 [Armatimonadaceae bacterium]